MSTPTSGLDSSEDQDNVPLIQLAEAQPHSSASPAFSDKKSSFEYIESGGTAFEDSQSADAAESEGTYKDEEDSDSGEMIVPEFVPDELPIVSIVNNYRCDIGLRCQVGGVFKLNI